MVTGRVALRQGVQRGNGLSGHHHGGGVSLHDEHAEEANVTSNIDNERAVRVRDVNAVVHVDLRLENLSCHHGGAQVPAEGVERQPSRVSCDVCVQHRPQHRLARVQHKVVQAQTGDAVSNGSANSKVEEHEKENEETTFFANAGEPA